MKHYFKDLYLNSWFLGFIFFFAYAQSIQTRVLVRDQINIYTFTPDGAVFNFFTACLLFLIIGIMLYWLKPENQKIPITRIIKIFGVSLLLYLFITNVLGFLVAFSFGNLERNFNPETLIKNNVNTGLDAIIYGGFFLANYLYFRNKIYNRRVAAYSQALFNSKIERLKAQLNPHFLFNNLNVLDQLIEEDKEKASGFLNDFADLYRYVLHASEKKLVPLEEELTFIRRYFNLLRQKYGEAFKLEIRQKNSNGGLIPPLSLQLLLENAVEHNAGSEEDPVYIQIDIDKKVYVSNTIKAKAFSKKTGGRALKNLGKQYELLSKETICIENDQLKFVVSLPIIINQD